MVHGESNRRMKIIFEGRVQGVGFRYTVCRAAEAFRVTGYVRNLMDGNVELVAEGTTDELTDFLNEVRHSHLARHIAREHVNWSGATGEYNTFGILF